MIFSVLLSLVFTSKLSQSIVSPIKEIQFIADRISKGDLNRRINISSADEIGRLRNNL